MTTSTGPAPAAPQDHDAPGPVPDDAAADPTLAWFDRLARDGDSRDFWTAHKDAYATDVRAPFTAYLAALDAAPGVPPHSAWRVYRPHNDLRFSPGGALLKTFVGAVAETPGGGGLYTQVDPAGLLVAVGMPWLAPDQLAAWRASVSEEQSGGELVRLLEQAARDGLDTRSGRPRPLVRPPRGVPADHPRGVWLRWKGVEALRRLGRSAWSDPADRVAGAAETLAAGGPLLAWLEAHVGPSALPRPRG